MTPDYNAILAVLMATDVSPLAREHAADLVEHWIRINHEADSKLKIIAVELGFSIWLDPDTLVIGVQDLIAEDQNGIFGNEWKTTKEPSKWWTEDKWLDEILRGSQLATYALAQREGTFYERGCEPFTLGIAEPRERVRAVVKSSPPICWPKRPESAYLSFSAATLDAVKNAYLAKAVAIREMRNSVYVPWQLPGKQCVAFNKLCPFYNDFCKNGNNPETSAVTIFDPSDPASEAALSRIPAEKLDNPNLVILSASSYETCSTCAEKYRIVSGSLGPKGKDLALDTGSAFHAGVAEWYRQMRAAQ